MDAGVRGQTVPRRKEAGTGRQAHWADFEFPQQAGLGTVQ